MDYKIIKYTDKYKDIFEIKVRNVGKLNPESQIQFEIEENKYSYLKDDYRTRHFSFSIPSDKAQEFIKAVTN